MYIKNKIFSLNIYLYLFFAFFPFLCFFKIGTDTQPYFLIFGSVLFVFILKDRFSMTRELKLLFFILFISIMLFFISSDVKNWIRGVSGYYNLAVGTYIMYYILCHHYKLFERFLLYSLVVWILVALVQIFYDRNFGIGLLSRMTNESDRGVISLSAEPTTFAIILLFYLLIIQESFLKYKNYIIYTLFFMILFLTQSSLFIMLSFIYLGYYSLVHLSWKRIFILIFFISLVGYIIHINLGVYARNYRIIELIGYIYENPLLFLQEGSINDRMASIYFPILGFMKSFGVFNGFGNYTDFITLELPKYDFFGVWVTTGNRIMSFYGSSLYELGVFSFALIFSINSIIYNRYKSDIKNMITKILFINTCLFMAIPLSTPIVSMYLAILIYRENNETSNNS